MSLTRPPSMVRLAQSSIAQDAFGLTACRSGRLGPAASACRGTGSTGKSQGFGVRLFLEERESKQQVKASPAPMMSTAVIARDDGRARPLSPRGRRPCAAVYPAHEDIDLDELADMVSSVIAGGIIVSRAVAEPSVTAQQIMLLRSYVKVLFSPKLA